MPPFSSLLAPRKRGLHVKRSWPRSLIHCPSIYPPPHFHAKKWAIISDPKVLHMFLRKALTTSPFASASLAPPKKLEMTFFLQKLNEWWRSNLNMWRLFCLIFLRGKNGAKNPNTIIPRGSSTVAVHIIPSFDVMHRTLELGSDQLLIKRSRRVVIEDNTHI